MRPDNTTELFRADSPDEAPLPETETHEELRTAGDRRAARTELLATLGRLERTLDEMRGGLDATARENRHREFSPATLLGAVAQVLVVGLELWALSDWVFGEPAQVLVKLSFAGVLQLGALTAFLLARDSGRV